MSASDRASRMVGVDRLAATGAGLVGRVLGGFFGALARLRRNRPLHPRGASYTAVVSTRPGGASGVPWLDTPGTTDVTLRLSRATGLPRPWPDVHGIALHVPSEALGRPGGADLLFASTGDSALGRFLLTVHREPLRGPLTTLLPVRTSHGPTLLRLVPGPAGRSTVEDLTGARYLLSYAVGRGRWSEVAEIVVGDRVGPDVDRRRHDPVLHTLPGAEQYAVVAALREPSYRAGRRGWTSPVS